MCLGGYLFSGASVPEPANVYDLKIGASQVKTRQFGAIRVYGVVSGLDISKQGLLPMNEGQRHIGSFLLFQLKIIKIHGNTKAGRNIFSKL